MERIAENELNKLDFSDKWILLLVFIFCAITGFFSFLMSWRLKAQHNNKV
jgi:hypothetical protein